MEYPVLKQIKGYANEDIGTIQTLAMARIHKQFGDRVTFHVDGPIDFSESELGDALDVGARIECDDYPFGFDINMTYAVTEGGEIYVDTSADEYADLLVDAYGAERGGWGIEGSEEVVAAEEVDYSAAIKDFFDSTPGNTYKTSELIHYLMDRFDISEDSAKKIYEDWDASGSNEPEENDYTKYFKFLDTIPEESESRVNGLAQPPEYYLSKKFNIPMSMAIDVVKEYESQL